MSTNTKVHDPNDETSCAKQSTSPSHSVLQSPSPPTPTGLPSHPLLLLSDSALPLGSFAFSSGLESYLAHHPPPAPGSKPFPHFLTLTLCSLATTTLPYLIATFQAPMRLQELDGILDACTLCPVARRASVAQGKALLTLWERALGADVAAPPSPAVDALRDFSAARKRAPSWDVGSVDFNGHFAPLWAAVTRGMGVTLEESVYTFLFNHAKAVLSAAVRASVMGPYAAQGLLASRRLRAEIEDLMAANWKVEVEEAGQGVPMCDLWVGRHDLLYSRIFNS